MRRLGISLVILITSVVSVAICQNASHASLKNKGVNSPGPNQDKPLSDIHFLPTGAVDGLTIDGFEFSLEGFKSSDGAGVSVDRQYCRTPENAERALAQRLRSATKILEQHPVVDAGGKQIGRRVVASFDDSEESKSGPAILWTKGNTFFAVESSSFKHALLMEEKVIHDEARPSL